MVVEMLVTVETPEDPGSNTTTPAFQRVLLLLCSVLRLLVVVGLCFSEPSSSSIILSQQSSTTNISMISVPPPPPPSTLRNFYDEYHGHAISQLDQVESYLRHQKQGPASSLIFLAGDSSLDNKFWFHDSSPARNGYELFLDPPTSREDIAHWLNVELQARDLGNTMAAINCAIEESSVGNRACGKLMPQDRFLRDHVTQNDVVVVSVGGNDIALKPALCTIVSMLLLMCCTTNDCLNNCTCGCAFPCDDCCCGCGCGCFSNCTAWPPGYGYFLHLFGTRIQTYVDNMTRKNRPKKILVCMIYYPDETPGGSWADGVLGLLGYNHNPQRLQILIRKVFRDATRTMKIPGSEVIGIPLFAAMNGKNTREYSQRVEPSSLGGRKMAKLIVDGIQGGQEAIDRILADIDGNSIRH